MFEHYNKAKVKIPEKLEELRDFLNKDFEIIDFGLPDPTFRPGTISRTNQLVKCPYCNNEFVQHVERGCFGGTRTPSYCPKCCFPHSFVEKYWKLKKKKNIINDHEKGI